MTFTKEDFVRKFEKEFGKEPDIICHSIDEIWRGSHDGALWGFLLGLEVAAKKVDEVTLRNNPWLVEKIRSIAKSFEGGEQNERT